MGNSIKLKMNFKNTILPVTGFLALVLVAGMVSPAFAQAPPTCSFNAGFSVGGNGTCVFVQGGEFDMFIIEENVTSIDARLYFNFDNLVNGTNYQVKKNITNHSGVTFFTFSHELLDPSGQANDQSFDQANAEPWTTPSFPTRFSHSNDSDGLSFAMSGPVPRTSDTWSGIDVDEFGTRDFLEFKDGALLNGTSDFTTFGLRDNNPEGNEPFLLAEAPRPISIMIGGTVGSMDTTSLIIAGAQANMGWWSIAMIGAFAIGAGIVYKVKSNKTNKETL